jgi:hypothetical protein
MDDLELERTLREALSEAPSPEFVARVRTTIAEAPRPSIVAGWLKPAAVLACAALLAIAVALPLQNAQLKLSPTERALSPTERTLSPTERALSPAERTLSPTAMAANPTATAPSPTANAPAPTVVVPTFRSARSGTPPARARIAIPNEPMLPEVIIAADDVQALYQLVTSASERRFLASFDETPASTPWVISELGVPPIIIEPLDTTRVHNN